MYKSIAAALAEDVRGGRLSPGTRLPTHRELADRLGVTVGTVTRAYAEAEAQGLVDATVGRGTFVRGRAPRLIEIPPAGVVDLTVNRPALGPHGDALGKTLAELARDERLGGFLDYVPPPGLPRHREAGARFLRELGHEVTADQVLVTCGAQSALGVLMAALTEPGDTVLVESLTYPGIVAAAHQCHVTTRGLELDEHGIVPEAFLAACRTERPRLVVCVPNHHNPTAVVMPDDRRRKLAKIARDHGVLVVEDDVYGFLLEDRPTPIRNHYPEGTCVVTCTSKSLVPGLRIGYVAVPLPFVPRVANAIRTTVWMAPPLMAEVASRWIEDGTAARLIGYQREETQRRQALAGKILGAFAPRDRGGFHVWMPLPDAWKVGAFVAALRERGVTVAPTEAFVVGATPVPNAVRLCVTAPRAEADLERGLGVVRALLDGPPDVALGTI
ncbi:MAG TPA: PLP-dependent aminotransferase family protein [Polyangiaceae bacterium]|nr:PLP-dependent aminotransferase family protein [Polyangiaceae bacterium]